MLLQVESWLRTHLQVVHLEDLFLFFDACFDQPLVAVCIQLYQGPGGTWNEIDTVRLIDGW